MVHPLTRKAMSPIDCSHLWSTRKAAIFLGFSPRTLEKWRGTGEGPAYCVVSSRCVRYRLQDLEAWVANRLRRSTCDPGNEGDNQ
ncbi:MAG: helix-turn-helix domain-containing protein [Thermoanaerobaculia bacterium]|nr:helix-turn-helix domain-containing protein [Thermoanaerobaculia bacterium]